MNLPILLEATRRESQSRRRQEPLAELKAAVKDLPPPRGFSRRLVAQGFCLIAEVKRKSPSMGEMNPGGAGEIAAVHRIYDRHPVVGAISVLTQEEHFGGNPEVLRRIARETRKPVLRKDFILDEYEVYATRAMGADAMLLMTNVVPDRLRFQELHDLAVSLGLDVLCEVHLEAEVEILPKTARLVGINSRNFASEARFGLSRITRLAGKDFTTDLAAFELFEKLPAGGVTVAESGLNARNVRAVLGKYGFNAALVGTSLLRGGPEHTVRELDRFAEAIQAAAPGPAPSQGGVNAR
jgi:indole-3-glycerol phosphate synthase